MSIAAAPTAGEQRLPLTNTQFLLWLGQTLNPDVPLYNMTYAFTLEGAIDVAAFNRAIQALIDSSDAFRTAIEVDADGKPYQVIRAAWPYTPDFVDLSHLADPKGAYEVWLAERKRWSFNLRGGLFDIALVKLAADRFVWYLNQHHIVSDAHAFWLIYRRVAAAYAQAVAGEPIALPPAPQFAAYVAEEQRVRQSEAFAAAQAVWSERLAAPVEPTRFYTPSPGSDTLETARVPVLLGRERTARLLAVAEIAGIRGFSRDLTLFNLFSTALVAFLHRIDGRRTLRVGAPVGNRASAEARDTIGVFIEVPALEVALDDDETFVSLVQKVQADAFALLRHGLPGTSSADMNRSYDVLLNYLPMRFPAFAGIPTTVRWVHSGTGDGAHKLRLQVHQFNGGDDFTLLFDFNRGVFDETAMQRAVDHFLRVVDALTADPQQPIGGFALLTDDAYATNVAQFNATEAPFPAGKTVVELFEEQAARTPSAPAVRQGGRGTPADGGTLSYAALNRAANRVAHTLRRAGIGRGDRVGVCLEHAPEMVIAVLGALKAGATYVPFDPGYPLTRIDYLLRDSDVKLVLTQTTLEPLFGGYDVRLLTVDGGWPAADGPDGDNPAVTLEPNDVAYMIYTSGSTGRPKGTMITHLGLTNYAWWARDQYCQGEALDFALFSSLAFDLTVTSIFVPLLAGGCVVVYREEGEARGLSILQVMAEDAVDVVKLTPAHLALVRQTAPSRTGPGVDQAAKPPQRRLKRLIVGGEDFKTALARDIHAQYGGAVEIYNEYGPTETVVGAMCHRFDPSADTAASVPIGRPIANAQVFVLDAYGQPVPPGVIGEMAIGGAGVARGYHNRPDLTDERFVTLAPDDQPRRLYLTGDLARWDAPGRMTFLGRADHQVKIRGARIELGEIEAALLAHPAIKEAVVTVVSSEEGASAERHCIRCGIADNVPGVRFDAAGVCHICREFDDYKDAAQAYFKSMDAFAEVAARMRRERRGAYDCVLLLSGGKDSSYMLYQVVEHGLNPLVFTLDNGYISEGAKANIRRIVEDLGVDHVFGQTEHMDAIFADSLARFSNVCNGCFKTIYTLATNLALEHDVDFIVTGLSRGQFFETRLTPDLFRDGAFDAAAIDARVLEARRIYHQTDDAVNRLLDVAAFHDPALFDRIEYVDFYRYCDVDLADVYAFLGERAPWIRPTDTGRSTNCLINDAGIYVHRRERGYHNYALPYSWDVRMGHKTRDEAVEELDDAIDVDEVASMLHAVGYTVRAPEPGEKRLAAYYVADPAISAGEVRAFLAERLPDYMLPAHAIQLDGLPLTPNGKVDRGALPAPGAARPELATAYQAPESPLEIGIADLWMAALNVASIGVHDRFAELGGTSLTAIQIVAGIKQRYQIDLPLRDFFDAPTVAGQAEAVEAHLIAAIEAMTDEEAAALLDSLG